MVGKKGQKENFTSEGLSGFFANPSVPNVSDMNCQVFMLHV
jgi:hypothetical protein